MKQLSLRLIVCGTVSSVNRGRFSPARIFLLVS